jgi:hypothetical protein
VLGGTTTLYDDLVHQLVMRALGERTAPWIAETHFEADYYPAILDEGTAAERSLWPAMWSLSWLLHQAYPTGDRRRMARSFAMNYQNRPELVGGSRWTHDTFVIDPRFTPGPAREQARADRVAARSVPSAGDRAPEQARQGPRSDDRVAARHPQRHDRRDRGGGRVPARAPDGGVMIHRNITERKINR